MTSNNEIAWQQWQSQYGSPLKITPHVRYWKPASSRSRASCLWIGLVIFSGIYLFLLLEYVMKMIVRFKDKSVSETKQTEVSRQIPSSFTVGRLLKYLGDRLIFQQQPVKTGSYTPRRDSHCFILQFQQQTAGTKRCFSYAKLFPLWNWWNRENNF